MTLGLSRWPFLEMPLLRKEVVGLLRTKRAFWLLAFTIAVSSLLPLLSWPSGGSSVTDTNMTVLSAVVFLLTQLTVSLLFIPAFAAGAISGEREQGTYELLHATLLSPSSIVISKALAAAGYVLLLLVASAPSVTVLHLLGGLEMGGILKCYAITFAAVVMSALVCLWASMRSERTSRAVLRGAVGVVFWNGGLFFLLCLGLALLDVSPMRTFGGTILYVATALSPHMAIGVQISREAPFPSSFAEHVWIAHIAGTSLISAAYFLLLLRRARHLGAASPLAERLAARSTKKRRRPLRRPLLTRLILALGWDGGLLGNPVFQKEIRSEFFGRLWYRRTVFISCLLIFLGMLTVQMGVGALDVEAAIGSITVVALFLVAVLSPGVAASAFPREIEQGNLDFLRGTLVPLGSALRGKFLASLYATFGIIAAAGWGMTASVLAYAHDSAWRGTRDDDWLLQSVVISAGVLVITWVLVTAVATLSSVLSKRTLGALVGSYAVLLAGFVILPIVCLVSTGGEGAFFAATHPLGALFSAMERAEKQELPAFFFLYTALSLALWLASSHAVEALRGRDP